MIDENDTIMSSGQLLQNRGSTPMNKWIPAKPMGISRENISCTRLNHKIAEELKRKSQKVTNVT